MDRKSTKKFLLSLNIPGLKEENIRGFIWDLSGLSFKYKNLSQRALFWADLETAVLKGTKCRGASFVFSRLQNANLRKADLREADLRKADLRGADLREANLRNADLRGADLRGANLTDAKIEGANFEGAELEGAEFANTKISRFNLKIESIRVYEESELEESFRLDLPKMNLYSKLESATPAEKLGLAVKKMFGSIRHYCNRFLFGLDRKDIE